jgi:hypothetical protein
MALWRNIGGLATIVPGATQYWEFYYPPNGRDVGVVTAGANMQYPQINVELIAEQGVVTRQTRVEEGVPEIHYTVRFRCNGVASMKYNLNIGDWQ